MFALGTLTLTAFPAGGKEGLPGRFWLLEVQAPDAQNQGGHTAAFLATTL